MATRKKAVRKAAVKKAVRKSTARTPPFPTYPAWSTAKFWGFLRSVLRNGYSKWPVKWDVLNAAKRAYQGTGKQQKWEYLCAKCQVWHKGKDVSVDHIIRAGALNCWEDLAGFCQRLFVGVDGLQVLCTDCHHSKTQQERKDK